MRARQREKEREKRGTVARKDACSVYLYTLRREINKAKDEKRERERRKKRGTAESSVGEGG